MADFKEILSDKDELLSDEDLLKYLQNNISEEEKYVIERKLTGVFESDAIDGLQQIKDKKRLQTHIKQLHRELPQLLQKKHRLEKKKLNDMKWIIPTIIFLLFLCIITFVLITMQK